MFLSIISPVYKAQGIIPELGCPLYADSSVIYILKKAISNKTILISL